MVLIPHTTLQLHVFESRYRALVEDLLRGDRWLSVVLLASGGTGDDGPPAIETVAGAGRLGRVSRLAGGRFHIEVEGMERVRLEEVPSDRPYRRARGTAFPLDPSWLGEREAVVALREMLRLARGLDTETQSVTTLPPDPVRRLALVNRLAARAFPGHRERQQVLEAAGARERVDLVRARLRLWARMVEAVERSSRPPDPRVN